MNGSGPGKSPRDDSNDQLYADAVTLTRNHHEGVGFWSVVPTQGGWVIAGPPGITYTPFEAACIAGAYRAIEAKAKEADEL